MKLSPERQQMVDTLLSELNTLKPHYTQAGFKFDISKFIHLIEQLDLEII